MTITGTSDQNYKWAYVKKLGHAILKNYRIVIGGQQIDKQYGEWLNIWYEFNRNYYTTTSYDDMIGNTSDMTNLSTDNKTVDLIIPLRFYFCLDSGLSLPIVSLYNQDIEFYFHFRDANECVIKEKGITNLGLTMTNVKLMVNYIYLDVDEREYFMNKPQEYLIEQVQYQSESVSGTSSRPRLNFNHPVKELVWGFKASTNLWVKGSCYGKAKIQLNGHDRFAERDEDYFRLVQPYQHHTSCDNENPANVYSFALNPEQHQPSGTCNFSRIDNAHLNFDCTQTGDLWLFAVNYNVLRIMSGMGGLAYSN